MSQSRLVRRLDETWNKDTDRKASSCVNRRPGESKVEGRWALRVARLCLYAFRFTRGGAVSSTTRDSSSQSRAEGMEWRWFAVFFRPDGLVTPRSLVWVHSTTSVVQGVVRSPSDFPFSRGGEDATGKSLPRIGSGIYGKSIDSYRWYRYECPRRGEHSEDSSRRRNLPRFCAIEIVAQVSKNFRRNFIIAGHREFLREAFRV